jgi:hypothetical protein
MHGDGLGCGGGILDVVGWSGNSDMGLIRGGGGLSMVGGDTMSTTCGDTILGSGGDLLHAGDVGQRVLMQHPRRQWQRPAMAPYAQASAMAEAFTTAVDIALTRAMTGPRSGRWQGGKHHTRRGRRRAVDAAKA